MRKFLDFMINKRSGQTISLVITWAMCFSLLFGLLLSLPIFWLGGKEYQNTWMNNIAPYFFYPFFCYVISMCILFPPYLWYVASSRRYKGDSKLLKGVAMIVAIIPGAYLFHFIADALLIPNGIHNLIGVIICGRIYVWLVQKIFQQPFKIVQDFLPLS